MDVKERSIQSLRKTASDFLSAMPLLLSVFLLASLFMTLIPDHFWEKRLGVYTWLDPFLAALAGGLAAGHPMTSYILGGELLAGGVSLVAVTALIVSWVTVGMIQLPAEILMLGKRLALYRNAINFVFSIVIAWLTVITVRLFE